MVMVFPVPGGPKTMNGAPIDVPFTIFSTAIFCSRFDATSLFTKLKLLLLIKQIENKVTVCTVNCVFAVSYYRVEWCWDLEIKWVTDRPLHISPQSNAFARTAGDQVLNGYRISLSDKRQWFHKI